MQRTCPNVASERDWRIIGSVVFTTLTVTGLEVHVLQELMEGMFCSLFLLPGHGGSHCIQTDRPLNEQTLFIGWLFSLHVRGFAKLKKIAKKYITMEVSQFKSHSEFFLGK